MVERSILKEHVIARAILHGLEARAERDLSGGHFLGVMVSKPISQFQGQVRWTHLRLGYQKGGFTTLETRDRVTSRRAKRCGDKTCKLRNEAVDWK